MAVASPNLSPSFVIAYVAIGAPPIVEGVTAEVKSQLNVILNAPNQLTVPSDNTLNFAAVAQTLKNDTMRAITNPGIRFHAK